MKECYTVRDWLLKITKDIKYDGIFINKEGDQAQLTTVKDALNFLNGLELIAPVALIKNETKQDYEGIFNIYKFEVYKGDKTKKVIITIVNYTKH